METHRQQPFNFFRFFAVSLVPFGLALALFYLLMRPPFEDFALLMVLMAITVTLAVFVAYAAYRLGWLHRSRRIRWTFVGVYSVAGLMLFLNVWIIAQMMFANSHDLLLATVLLVFSTGIAMTLAFFLSDALTARILHLNRAASEIARGKLTIQVEVIGRDEMAQLTVTFNSMTAQLAESQRKQQELDGLRRDLIAWVGHDLRTPLTSIRAILEALADGLVEDPATVQRYLRTAQHDIRTLSHLIDDLFEMSQLDAGGMKLEKHPMSIADLVSDTLESFSALAQQQGVTLTGRMAPDIDPVCMDAPRIGRVMANLIGNAIRHTPRGGQVNIHGWRDENEVQVEVQDSGEGIPADDLPHVFDRFYRGDKSRSSATGGAGLGLAIARGIVEAHGGTIRVESESGKGARFVFSLPG